VGEKESGTAGGRQQPATRGLKVKEGSGMKESSTKEGGQASRAQEGSHRLMIGGCSTEIRANGVWEG